jgi:hypothetical protein
MMIDNDTVKPQGPFTGSHCIAAPDGRWHPATIRRVNEDGTFNIEIAGRVELVTVLRSEVSADGTVKRDEYDEEEIIRPSNWFGVTPAEVSSDDDRQWPIIFAQISPDGRSFTWTNFRDTFSSFGYQNDPDLVRQLWDQGCQKLFNIPAEKAESYSLNEAMAYQFFLHHGFSAKQFTKDLKSERTKPYYKKYFDRVRMGGRDPEEILRGVTLQDAFVALGLADGVVDKSAVAFLQRFEREQGVHLPATLVELLQREGIAHAVFNSHPNCPGLVDFENWNLLRGMREQGLSGNYALEIVEPNEGGFHWVVVFDDEEDDARVYYAVDDEVDEPESWQLTAPGIGFFFWDLAQTGLAWYQDTRFEGGKPVKRSDIGLILDK